MKINYKKKLDLSQPLLLLPIFSESKDLPEHLAQWLESLVSNSLYINKVGANTEYFSNDKDQPQRTLVWGLGEKEKLSSSVARNTISLAIKRLREKNCSEIALYWTPELDQFAREIGEAIALANYFQPLFKTGQSREEALSKVIQKVTIVSADLSRLAKYEFEEGLKIGEAVNQVRDLCNSPSNIVSVDSFAKKAEEVASKNRYKIKILDLKQLEKLKMGALLGVNRGSELGAKMIVLEYLPMGKKQEPVALVGKGVTFDTGGVNLKPTAGLADMKKDMSGAAAVLGVFMLLKELEVKQNVVGFIPLTDNAVDAKSLKPSDIVTSFSGKTIEVANTDAEGRLILADAISYAIKNYHPSSIIDIATLTGACLIALGDQYAGIFGNNDALKLRLKNAGLETDELVWEMPIHEEHRKGMKGTITDLVNIDGSGLAGASTAAAFLEEFVEKTDWVHIDIAGPAIPKKFKDYDFSGSSTGYGVRLLLSFFQNIK